jgi:sulfatase maturation enzyme AslB (radical SAM superfamily)
MQFNAPNEEWQLDIDKGNTTGHPTWVDIRPGRFCNLKCRMCFSSVSSKISEEISKHPNLIKITGDYGCNTEEWIDDPVLFKNLQDWIPHLTIVKLAGGEPFFMPGVIKLLKWCVDSGNTHIALDITTNGTRLNGKVATWLSAFSDVQIHVSIDGIGKLNDYIRHGSKWDEVSKSYEYYLDKNMTADILATVQIYNAHHLADIIRYWRELGAKNHLVFNFVDAPSDLSIDLLPIEDRLKIANEIELLTDDLSPALKSKCRFNATIAKFRKDIDPVSVEQLRQKWISRTDALDEIRNEKLELVNPELFTLYTTWKKTIR